MLGPRGTNAVLIAVAASLATSCMGLIANGSGVPGLAWSVGTHLVIVLLIAVGRAIHTLERLAWITTSLSTALCTAVLVQRVLLEQHYRGQWPADLGFGNQNLVAATAATLGALCLAAGNRPLALVSVSTALLVSAIEGSVTATSAVLAATAAAAYVHDREWRRWLCGATTLVIAIVLGLPMVARLIVHAAYQEPSRNLLVASSSLQDPRWTKYGIFVVLRDHYEIGPEPGLYATRINAKADASSEYPTLILNQGVEQSRPEEYYVASAYLRGTVAATVVLSSNLAASDCRVSTSWTRCVTPAARGDGVLWVQLQVHAAEPGGSVDFQLAGAQVERSRAVSTPQNTSQPTWLRLARRLGDLQATGKWTPRTSALWRLDQIKVAWNASLSRPVIGIGRGAFGAYYEERRAEYVTSSAHHAHNQVLNTLAEEGIAGFVALLLPIAAGVVVTWDRRRREWLIVLPALLILQLGDATYFFSGVLYPLWAFVGVLLAGDN